MKLTTKDWNNILDEMKAQQQKSGWISIDVKRFKFTPYPVPDAFFITINEVRLYAES